MLYWDIFRILAYYLFGFSSLLLIPLGVAIYYQFYADPSLHPQPHGTFAFAITLGISLFLALICHSLGRRAIGHFFKKEGVAVVVIFWLLTPAISAYPFIYSGTLTNPFKAYFEATSGLTTTGATVLQAKKYNDFGKEIPIVKVFGYPNETTYSFYGTVPPVRDPLTNKTLTGVEAVGKAVLFWRSFLQWFGGAGIVVLFVAIFPLLGMSGKLLYQTELTGPFKEATTPRVARAALQLWMIYFGLTILQIFCLIFTNPRMEWLEATTITFSTVSTGGFSIHNESIAYYHSAWTEWVVIIFMILGAINFSLYYQMLQGRFYRLYQPELFLYCLIILFSCGLATWYLNGTYKELLSGETGIFNLGEAARQGSFQIISSLTSTGFATANYDRWPYVIQVLMVILMFVGGMSGSTAGGIKVIRHYILFRIAQFKVESLFRTDTVRIFRVQGQEVDSGTSGMVLCFFFFTIVFSTLGTFLYVLDGIDPETSFGLVACCVNNVGLGWRMGGPTESFAFLSDFSLILSSLLMILGRLEFFVVLAVLVPAFWKQS